MPTHEEGWNRKADRAAIDERREWIELRMAEGLGRAEIARLAAAQFKISVRHAYREIDWVYGKWQEEGEVAAIEARRAEHWSFIWASLRRVVNVTITGEEPHKAVPALAHMAKLAGVEQAAKVEHSVGDSTLSGLLGLLGEEGKADG